jgi:hypothetical protein
VMHSLWLAFSLIACLRVFLVCKLLLKNYSMNLQITPSSESLGALVGLILAPTISISLSFTLRSVSS